MDSRDPWRQKERFTEGLKVPAVSVASNCRLFLMTYSIFSKFVRGLGLLTTFSFPRRRSLLHLRQVTANMLSFLLEKQKLARQWSRSATVKAVANSVQHPHAVTTSWVLAQWNVKKNDLVSSFRICQKWVAGRETDKRQPNTESSARWSQTWALFQLAFTHTSHSFADLHVCYSSQGNLMTTLTGNNTGLTESR